MCIHPCKSLWIKASAKCKCSLPRRLALQCALALRGTALCARPPLVSLCLSLSLALSLSLSLSLPPTPLCVCSLLPVVRSVSLLCEVVRCQALFLWCVRCPSSGRGSGCGQLCLHDSSLI